MGYIVKSKYYHSMTNTGVWSSKLQIRYEKNIFQQPNLLIFSNNISFHKAHVTITKI